MGEMQEMASSISSLVRIWNMCCWCSSEGSPVTSENHRLLDLDTMATQRKYFKFLGEPVPDVYVVFCECYKLNVYFALNTCIWYTWNLVIWLFGLISKERKTMENNWRCFTCWIFHLAFPDVYCGAQTNTIRKIRWQKRCCWTGLK